MFRKMPVVIEARQFIHHGDERLVVKFSIIDWIRANGGTAHPQDDGIRIATLEGDHLASHGDWIIKGIKGEFYPCKPDIFATTYTQVTEAEAMATTGQHVKPADVYQIKDNGTLKITGQRTSLSGDRSVTVTKSDSGVVLAFTTMHGHKQVSSMVVLSEEAAQALAGLLYLSGFKEPALYATTVEVPNYIPAPTPKDA
jgi:hypothetical protein